MKARLAILALMIALAALVSTPARLHGQQGTTPAPSQATTPQANMANMAEMMARMKATDPKLDALVKKMNAATGAAKTDAIAELLTAVVEDRRNNCQPMMANMMSMMNMMAGRGGRGAGTPATPSK